MHCALSGFGQTGPYRDRAGHDLTYCAVAGALSLSGTAQRPVMTFSANCRSRRSHAGGKRCTGRASEKGAKRQGSLSGYQPYRVHSGLAVYGLSVSQSEHQAQRERLLLNGGAACYNIYITSDGRFVTLAALETKFWKAFCLQTDHPEWISRHQETLPQKELITELQRLFSSRSLAQWKSILAEADCCFEPIPDIVECAIHMQFAARASISGLQPAYPGLSMGTR